MRSTLLLSAFSLLVPLAPGLVAQNHDGDDLRRAIRQIVREEIRSALKEMLPDARAHTKGQNAKPHAAEHGEAEEIEGIEVELGDLGKLLGDLEVKIGGVGELAHGLHGQHGHPGFDEPHVLHLRTDGHGDGEKSEQPKKGKKPKNKKAKDKDKGEKGKGKQPKVKMLQLDHDAPGFHFDGPIQIQLEGEGEEHDAPKGKVGGGIEFQGLGGRLLINGKEFEFHGDGPHVIRLDDVEGGKPGRGIFHILQQGPHGEDRLLKKVEHDGKEQTKGKAPTLLLEGGTGELHVAPGEAIGIDVPTIEVREVDPVIEVRAAEPVIEVREVAEPAKTKAAQTKKKSRILI